MAAFTRSYFGFDANDEPFSGFDTADKSARQL